MFDIQDEKFAEYAASSQTRQLTRRTLALVLAGGRGSRPVSYTHLTLPTILLV